MINLLAQHVLTIKRIAGGILGDLEHHRPQSRSPRLMSHHGLGKKVGHKPALELGKLPQDIAGFLIVSPRNAIAGIAVQAAMRGKKAKGDPSLVHRGASVSFIHSFGSTMRASPCMPPFFSIGSHLASQPCSALTVFTSPPVFLSPIPAVNAAVPSGL